VRSADGSVVSGTAPQGVALAPNTVVSFDRTGSTSAVPNMAIDTFTISVAGNGRVTVTP
jgi:hypothetical protein